MILIPIQVHVVENKNVIYKKIIIKIQKFVKFFHLLISIIQFIWIISM